MAAHRSSNLWLELTLLFLCSGVWTAAYVGNKALFDRVLPRLIERPSEYQHKAPGFLGQQARPVRRYA